MAGGKDVLTEGKAAAETPNGIGDLLDEGLFGKVGRAVMRGVFLTEGFVSQGVLVRQEHGLGAEPVLDGVKFGAGRAVGSVRSSRFLRV